MTLAASTACNVDVKDTVGNTSLIRAARILRLDHVTWLLWLGADPDVCNDAGETALAIALQHQAEGVVDALLAHGASVNAMVRTDVVRKRMPWCVAPLMSPLLLCILSYARASKTAQKLLCAGALPEIFHQDLTLEVMKKLRGNLELFQLFVVSGFRFDLGKWIAFQRQEQQRASGRYDKDIYEFVVTELKTPLRLTEHCRITIRSTITRSTKQKPIKQSVHALGLPTVLVRYLKYDGL